MTRLIWVELSSTEQGLNSQQQTFDFQTIREAHHPDLGASLRLRATVHADSYANQCRYTVDFWTGAKWEQIAMIYPSDPGVLALAKLPYSNDEEAKYAAVDSVIESLLARAEQVLL